MASFLSQEVIRAKRDGGLLSDAEIGAFVAGLTDGSITDGQVAALAMAIFFQGLTAPESVALTRAMTGSGRVIAWPDLGKPILDKHSTGGVGDKVSLMLAPILAACGAAVPMISGRGLGHTGGTLDKLDAIPGYNSTPDVESFQRVVAEAGCAIIGQTADLAPADRRLYAIRDVTATVESIPLITASILSKKLAAGLQGLVMDVKVGSGAFMPDLAQARALARSIVSVACGAGLPTRALITDMSQILGSDVGNALEVREAVEYLTGARREARLDEVVRNLCAALLRLGALADSDDAAGAMIARVLDNGAAAEAFQRMLAALGGPADFVDDYEGLLPRADVIVSAHAPDSAAEGGSYVAAVDARALGVAVLALGGGRSRADQSIDYAVGLTAVAGIGDRVGPERPLALVHARSADQAEAAVATLQSAFDLSDAPTKPGPVIHEEIAEIPA